MIYLLGGAPRAGKTTAAHRFVDRTGVSCSSIDFLKMGLVRGMPDYGIDLYDDPATAVKLWPILRGMIHTYAEEEESILIEGYYLLPAYAAELHRDLADRIRSCFIGFCEMDTMRKVRELREHAPGDWSSGDDEDAVEMAEHLKSVSREIRADCTRLGLRYFDNVESHDRTLDEVVAYLAGSE
ncbi:MAG: hypothetical protein HN712_08100 [Gemmatimonadetes bacterium]|jgi:hypothetical protein|nr:hypothetical protein [Gemmatimonadota bacterium]MBT6150126.1 hypothetical protein [Gemmatimonadota bacterium]MBT7860261.1 hypothetical protein [Gemmatimonadota bacterium]